MHAHDLVLLLPPPPHPKTVLTLVLLYEVVEIQVDVATNFVGCAVVRGVSTVRKQEAIMHVTNTKIVLQKKKI